MVENIQVVPRERISERMEEQIIDVLVFSIEDVIADVRSSSHVAAHAVPSTVDDYLTTSPADTSVVPVLDINDVTPTPVFEYIAPAPSVTSNEQFSPACTMEAVTTGVSSDTTDLKNAQCSSTAVEAVKMVSSASHEQEQTTTRRAMCPFTRGRPGGSCKCA